MKKQLFILKNSKKEGRQFGIFFFNVLKASISETPKSNADKRKTFTAAKKDLDCSHTFEPTGMTWI